MNILKTFQKAREAMIVGALLAWTAPAFAQTGWMRGVKNTSDLAQAGITLVVYIFLLLGLIAFGSAGKALWDMSKGRDEEINVGKKVVLPIIGGAFMVAIWYVGLNSVETLGGSSSDIGRQR